MIGLTLSMRPTVICGLGRSSSQFLAPISIFETKRKRRDGVFSSLDGVGSDSNLHAAIRRASLRFQESLRPDPLFIDPYAEYLVFPEAGICGMKEASLSSTLYYGLATKFIDDTIINEMISLEEFRQIVLLTDGMDTRPYRLNWPRNTVIYDVSPESVFKRAHKKLQDIGATVSKTCMLVHISLESSDLQELLTRKGFSGNKPSLWVLQGLPLTSLAEFGDRLSTVSNLAMKGCHFIGEFPCWLIDTELEDNLTTQGWMDKLFFSHGFRVSLVNYVEVARNVHDVAKENSVNVLFVAKQLRLSDAQMQAWRAHFERIEEEGDEEGFEEL